MCLSEYSGLRDVYKPPQLKERKQLLDIQKNTLEVVFAH